jgi:hypothetical protein
VIDDILKFLDHCEGADVIMTSYDVMLGVIVC